MSRQLLLAGRDKYCFMSDFRLVGVQFVCTPPSPVRVKMADNFAPQKRLLKGMKGLCRAGL